MLISLIDISSKIMGCREAFGNIFRSSTFNGARFL